jgi:hypothetical protein
MSDGMPSVAGGRIALARLHSLTAAITRPATALALTPRARRCQRAPLTTQCGGHSQSAEPLARPDAFALCSIASIGARSRSP